MSDPQAFKHVDLNTEADHHVTSCTENVQELLVGKMVTELEKKKSRDALDFFFIITSDVPKNNKNKSINK